MEDEIYQKCLKILKEELVPALGCTEPCAVAYATAKGAELLGGRPDHLDIWCSGNIVKNVKSVLVPNTGGLKGIEAAAIAGAIGGNAERGLELLESLNDRHRRELRELVKTNYCTSHLLEQSENLHIIAKLTATANFVEVEIKTGHTNITKLVKNGRVVFSQAESENAAAAAAAADLPLTVKAVLEFAESVKLKDVADLLDRQIALNSAIAAEGLKNSYGAAVGKNLLKHYGNDVRVRAMAKAAAGSDARMNGCVMPVVINSGSGNQGLAVSLPVIEFADELGVSKEKLHRALCVSNLTALVIKQYIGRLSAYCGAVCAACGSAAAITYLHGGDYEQIARTITNHLANVSGIVCDGAKSSCAAKIASAVDAGIMAHYLSEERKTFLAGDGLVKENVEQTIRSVGRMGRDGMRETDIEILNIMMEA